MLFFTLTSRQGQPLTKQAVKDVVKNCHASGVDTSHNSNYVLSVTKYQNWFPT